MPGNFHTRLKRLEPNRGLEPVRYVVMRNIVTPGQSDATASLVRAPGEQGYRLVYVNTGVPRREEPGDAPE